MSRRTTKPHHLAGIVVSEPAWIQEWAAWKLLYAVKELFPERFDELEAIRYDFDFAIDPKEREDFEYRVWRWTQETRLVCDAVEKAALGFAEGQNGPPQTMLVLSTDKIALGRTRPSSVDISDSIKTQEGLSAIEAEPLDETLDEFLIRATEHYHRKRDVLAKYGFERIRKREYEHFRYLVAHLVGGYSWAQLATGDTPLNLPKRAERTIAEGARETARLIGLHMRSKPGPRPGSRLHRAAHRVPRSGRR